MVKLYITTERVARYNKRCNNKQISEMQSIIKKKTDDVHEFIEDNRQISNSLSRSNGFNKMIYNAYSGLYNRYTNIVREFDKMRVYLRVTEEKLKKTTELYENLEDIYNEKVEECERLNKVEKTEECERLNKVEKTEECEIEEENKL